MQITTKELLAARAANEWKLQGYPEEVYNQLKALGKEATPELVGKIVGNDSWTEILCQECMYNRPTICFVAPGTGATVQVCKDCLIAAADMLPETEKESDEIVDFTRPPWQDERRKA